MLGIAAGQGEVEVVGEHHRAGLQFVEREEGTPQLDGVCRQPARGLARPRGHRLERGRRARPGGAEHQQVPVAGLERRDRLPLLSGQVAQAETDAVGERQLRMRHDRRQRIAPRSRCGCGGVSMLVRDSRRAVHVAGCGESELHEPVSPRTVDQHSPTPRRSRQPRRGVVADQAEAVGTVGHPQHDPHGDVREHGITHDACRTLGAQDQVHAEGPSACRQVGEQGVQLGALRDERGEFIHHDDQPRERARRQVVDGAGSQLRQHPLAAQHLGAQRLDRTPGEPFVEIAQGAEHVRESGEGREGRTTLEVDEHERHLGGTPAGRHREHPRHEKLALARTCRAGNHGVRAVGDEVEQHGTVDVDADRSREPGARRGFGLRAEAPVVGLLAAVIRIEQFAQQHHGGQCRLGRAQAEGAGCRRQLFRAAPGRRTRRRIRVGRENPVGAVGRTAAPRDHDFLGRSPRRSSRVQDPEGARGSVAHGVRKRLRPLLPRRRGEGRVRRRDPRRETEQKLPGDRGRQHLRAVDANPRSHVAHDGGIVESARLGPQPIQLGRLRAGVGRSAELDPARHLAASDRDDRRDGCRPLRIARGEPPQPCALGLLGDGDPATDHLDVGGEAGRLIPPEPASLPSRVGHRRDRDHR